MTLQDDIINLVQNSWQDPLHSPLAQVLGASYVVAYIVAIGIAIFIGVRFLRRYSMYAGKGTPYGAYSIHFIGGEGYAHGNLSKNEWFDEDSFNKIKKQEKEYYVSFEEFERMISNNEIYIYDFKVTDHSKVWTFKEIEDVVLIANGKMNSDDFSVIEKESRFSFTSTTFHETARTVGAFPASKTHFKINDPYGKERHVWYLELIPQNPEKIMTDSMTKEFYKVEIKRIGNVEALAKAVIQVPTMIKQQEEIEKKSLELTDYRRLLLKEQERNKNLNALVNKANYFLNQKIFVGYSRPQTPLQRASEMIFIFVAWLTAVIGYEEMPKTFPSIPPIMFALVGLVIVILLREIWKKKQPTPENNMLQTPEEAATPY